MRIYVKNNPATFHPDLFWNDGALSFFEEGRPNKNKKKKKKTSSDMRSVPDLNQGVYKFNQANFQEISMRFQEGF